VNVLTTDRKKVGGGVSCTKRLDHFAGSGSRLGSEVRVLGTIGLVAGVGDMHATARVAVGGWSHIH
jgi:hypothetical protein